MSKLSQWKKILGHSTKPKVAVQVAGKSEQMTQTQSYRFEELAAKRGDADASLDNNPLSESSYTLGDAAFRLMLSEDELLQRAAAGSVYLYVETSGLSGRWRCRAADGSVVMSSSQTLGSGLLALGCAACRDLADAETAQVTALCSTPQTHGAPPDAWIGEGKRGGEPDLFLLADPLLVSRDGVALLPPLSSS